MWLKNGSKTANFNVFTSTSQEIKKIKVHSILFSCLSDLCFCTARRLRYEPYSSEVFVQSACQLPAAICQLTPALPPATRGKQLSPDLLVFVPHLSHNPATLAKYFVLFTFQQLWLLDSPLPSLPLLPSLDLPRLHSAARRLRRLGNLSQTLCESYKFAPQFVQNF